MPQSSLLSHTRLTLQFAIAFAFAKSLGNDPRWNYKLLEGPWYGFWCAVLVDIFAGIPECIVFPQYPLLVIPEIDDCEDTEDTPGLAEEGSDDGDEQEEEGSPGTPQDSEAPQAHVDLDSDSELAYGEGGLTPDLPDETASDPTTPSPRSSPPPLPDISIAKSFRITDFAVLHLTGVVGDDPFALSDDIASVSDLQALPVKITDVLIPLILENKKVLADIRQLNFAQGQVCQQARFLFHQNQDQQYVVALVAAGSVWKWAKITRGHAKPPSSASSIMDPSYVDEPPAQRPNWSLPLTFGTPESMNALKKIYTLVKILLEMNESSVHQENPQTHEYPDHDGDYGQNIDESEGHSTPTRNYLSTRPPVSPATTDSLNIISLEPPQTPTPSARSVINKRSCPSSSSPNPPTTLSKSPTESPPIRQPKKRVRRIVLSPSPFPSSSSPNSPAESPPIRQPRRRAQRMILSPSPSDSSGTEDTED
ncbi:uncharacterized protein LACBIDRAFT_310580 [Laccaria bicolor S238N-H82]|uniref:Predicted protein n=1 Tax=Laccaria bicolor (strain S238N-H82 / ATCC MYA-4686) TaxID=486041 RepID=B0DUM5_LACBS|nr:uncharacterized protein LACBIDRAFT_310580 [Laccaria bicolor S238N-H82]EDR01643.1 predicted protein [Laccaria bicolor S238N-H82]|eukprot:XP_001887719.1 predicted protein [Laccaria bicolor S238N-H82]